VRASKAADTSFQIEEKPIKEHRKSSFPIGKEKQHFTSGALDQIFGYRISSDCPKSNQ
jgi:hypothetical protein